MPVHVSYPGVYVQELPSGVQTITGVATSIGAFVGWAAMGPTSTGPVPITQPILVQSFQDFANQFGGLDARSNLGYAVSQFFNNGGQQAYIVRLLDTTSSNKAAAASTATALSGMTFQARNEGQWGNSYTVTITPTPQGTDNSRFKLQVSLTASGTIVETIPNLSTTPTDGRYVLNVLPADSQFITVTPTSTPSATPAAGSEPLTGGNDGNVLKPSPLYPTDPFPPPSVAGGGIGTVSDFLNALEAGGGTGGVNLLTRVSVFNLLCVPGLSPTSTPTDAVNAAIQDLQAFCVANFAFLIVDSDENANVTSGSASNIATEITSDNITGSSSMNSAVYFPWVSAPDPLNQNRLRLFPPCGFVAGVYASTDASRGVWTAPAGGTASLTGAAGLQTTLTDQQNGILNPLGINCLRNFPVFGNVVWGARTLQGNDQIGSQWKYIPVKRIALFIEKSLLDGTKFAVFEPNADPLWAELRLAVGTFMQNLFRQGAFAGQSAADAFFVKCDSQTTTQADINNGIVNILVGFAPLLPAEFVIIQIQQIAGQAQA